MDVEQQCFNRIIGINLELASEKEGPICFETFDRMIRLHCQHTLCAICLSQWVLEYEKTECPSCRTELFITTPLLYILRRRLSLRNNDFIIKWSMRGAFTAAIALGIVLVLKTQNKM